MYISDNPIRDAERREEEMEKAKCAKCVYCVHCGEPIYPGDEAYYLEGEDAWCCSRDCADEFCLIKETVFEGV